MFIPFNDMPDNSKIWIYQADRELSDSEANEIKKSGENFVSEWTAHNQSLYASFEILHNIFLVITVDENYNDASGCSIDKSVDFIRQTEKKFNISLLDRMNIAFRRGEKVYVKPLSDFLQLYRIENFTDQLPVFNNLIFNKADLKTNWEIPLKESWVRLKIED